MENSQEALSELMFFVLMAFYQKNTFGSEIAEFIKDKTLGRIIIGPGTLYTILSRFEKDKWIKELLVEGRRRTYGITDLGRSVFLSEIDRMDHVLKTAMRIRDRKDS